MDIWNHTSLSDFILLGLFSYSPYDFFLFSLVLLASATALAGNILFLLLTQADRRLHTPMYFFLSQVSIMDLIMMGTVVPKMAANFLSGSKIISWGGCATQVFLVVMVGGAECFLLAVMAYDRYVAVCHPLRYPVLMNWKACCLMSLASWMGGVADSVIDVGMVFSFPYCGSLRWTTSSVSFPPCCTSLVQTHPSSRTSSMLAVWSCCCCPWGSLWLPMPGSSLL